MAILETLIRSAIRSSKTAGSLSPLLLLRRLTSTSPPPLPPLPFSPLPSCLSLPRSRLLSPLAAAGPLFLASPAWKLSQTATPLYFHGKVEILKVKEGGPPVRPVLPGKESDALRNDRDEVADSIWNLPNLISISRMVSGPVIGWMILNEWYVTSFVSLALSGITDWLDGFVARRMKINSVLGSYLDPLADKVLICCVALSMVRKDLLHPGLVVLVVVRDVGLIGGAIYKRASILGWQWRCWSDFVSLNTTRPEKVQPLFISKVNTVFQLLLVAAALLQPEFGSDNTQWCITYWSWLVASTTVASSIAYGAHHLRGLPASVNAR